mmetsp:Transcript_49099/g.147838  ORF Transcript_49099/g.147838 Transcript_49099/m.147838 type:complete len:323 (-) Transcript_49099:324-1292(-)|eukprot:CAMPEP_0113553200 /NCGR_PEP_ID=MMETSP0015_2-20120614/15482_1 /TAXON_ID=2838 /ORGANISM="Odontella" /LENGTH=322 /DNA_ID=CAMNT_0000454245 /DNA_START=22 /DNA_END=990 /DNA_ORIENTATION=- /assembly_acc=CAM_ASM_000160
MKGVQELLKKQGGVAVLDGGLGTAMQSKGADLDRELWSAHYIKEDPRIIQTVHREYYEAGADIVITASYQASVDLFVNVFGLSAESEAEDLIAESVEIAARAKEEVREAHKSDLLVAASVGPYGACLGGGEEYHGRYGEELGEQFLEEWHRRRFQILVDRTSVDILAIETLPCLAEVRALLNLLPSRPKAKAWISVSCTDERTLRSGEKLADFIHVVESKDELGQVEAIGVNCTPPKFMPAIIKQIRSQTSRVIVVYPNNGAIYDGERRVWLQVGDKQNPDAYANEALKWKELGSPIIIGGCCMTDRHIIRAMSNALHNKDS